MKSKYSGKHNESLKRRVSDISEVPSDIIRGVAILTVTCGSDLRIENYSGIIEYTDTLIRVRTRNGQIHIKGKGLRVEYFTNDEMKIHGRVNAIEFA